ncbi:Putative acyl-activating enzyme 19 [Linum perenne]
MTYGCCCLSHEFIRAASKNQRKLAVIVPAPAGNDPDGGRRRIRISDRVEAGDSISSALPSRLPMYEGDETFTFGEVIKSVEYLSFRLRSFLDGAGGDSGLFCSRSLSGNLNQWQDEEGTKIVYRPRIVGIYMAPSVEYIVSVLSVLRCGEAFLPLDPGWPRDRILQIVSLSNVDLIITCASLFEEDDCGDEPNWLAESTGCSILFFTMSESLEGCSSSSASGLVWPCQRDSQRLFCYLMYTSGSTGVPKGVCGTEQGLLNRFQWMNDLYPVGSEEILIFKASISFVDHLQEFLCAMLSACTLVIPPFRELKDNPSSIVNFLQAYSVNRLTAVPSLMKAIVPALENDHELRIQSSLKLLILSGEVFPLPLWDTLSKLLSKTSILNIYGSTEVSGDCTYFDCKNLPMMLKTEELSSVPIGMPISGCAVEIIGEDLASDRGEIFVSGLCVSAGYFSHLNPVSFDLVKLHENSVCNCSSDNCGGQLFYRTGDFGKKLQSGDLVFAGRKDRTVKVNGQRVALEEIESVLRAHPSIIDAAVVAHDNPGDGSFLSAFLVLTEKDISLPHFQSSIRSWMINKVPLAMIPNSFTVIESLPFSSSGKVDYSSLVISKVPSKHDQIKVVDSSFNSGLLHVIKKAFSDALLVEEVSGDDDFFSLGGNSITAASVSYRLGINLKLLYSFPTPLKLLSWLERLPSCKDEEPGAKAADILDSSLQLNSVTSSSLGLKQKRHLKSHPQKNENHSPPAKQLKLSLDRNRPPSFAIPSDEHIWAALIPTWLVFSRCNKVMHEREYKMGNQEKLICRVDVTRKRKPSCLEELWKVDMKSCVDASPLLVFKDHDVYLLIGSHSHKFTCVNARSGSVMWEVKLDGRVECSAAIIVAHSQVVVGCYKGKIYFLDLFNGNLCWSFQTGAEVTSMVLSCSEVEMYGSVKCQPVVDMHRQLIWCGSHDHNLYALDYKNQCCVYKLECGGSIFGSPSIDEVRKALYVSSTSGRVTAVSLEGTPFHSLWKKELEVPIFGSLSVDARSGNVVCCLVDGNIIALDSSGSIRWKSTVGGPVFAGACTSLVLPRQVIICSRNGSVYSLDTETGDRIWEHQIGDPITASAYIDEHLQLFVSPSSSPRRLICVCSSSGTIHLLQIDAGNPERCSNVQEFARFELPGDVFSSPVMVGGRIFVGCRDDYVRCIAMNTEELGMETDSAVETASF